MLGQLPKTLTINGKSYRIRTDYRNILRIFEAFADKDLSDKEKMLVCLRRMFVDFSKLPYDDYKEAYEQVYWFIGCGKQEEKRPPVRTFNWIKDEPLMFPAVNKAAGLEVRAVPYLHWWTFMGYFESIDAESLFGTVLSIRQKKARGKKLEKYEREFMQNNKALMALDVEEAKPRTAEEKLLDMFNDLIAEDSEGGE